MDDPKLLLSAIGVLAMFILGLIFKMFWEFKKDLRDQKGCINTKKDKSDCVREMDEVKGRME
jgi:hypothetical protein